MNTPTNLKYTKSHEWVLFKDETTARLGLTDYAQDAMGGVVFVNLPAIGDEVQAGESFGEVESVKAVSDVLSPLTGTVSLINEELLDSPEKINETPYESWLIEVTGVTEADELLDSAAYEAFCEEA